MPSHSSVVTRRDVAWRNVEPLREVLHDLPNDSCEGAIAVETPVVSITKKKSITQQTSMWLRAPLKGDTSKTNVPKFERKMYLYRWIISQTFHHQLGFPSASVSVLAGWRLTLHYQSADRLLLHDPQETGRTLKWKWRKMFLLITTCTGVRSKGWWP